MVCYAGKQEKPFWFSSLDQIVQFSAKILCRTFRNYFGQFVWIERKRKATIIVAFHFMKRRLKRNRIVPYYQLRRLHLCSVQYLLTCSAVKFLSSGGIKLSKRSQLLAFLSTLFDFRCFRNQPVICRG